MPNDTYNSYRIPIPDTFSEVFSHFYIVENNSPEPVTKSLIPTFQTLLVFSFGIPVKLAADNSEMMVEKCLVLGPLKKSLSYTLPPGAEMFVVSFKDDAFYRFFGLLPFADHIPVNPDDLIAENCFTLLWHKLKAIGDSEERSRILLDFCVPYLKTRSETAALLADFTNETQSAIKAVAQITHKTERTIQQEHKKHFGFSAKEKMRYSRFLKTMQYLQQAPKEINWQDIVHTFGYYDQSQLIHDFKYYINISPKQYLAFQQHICMGNG